VQESSLLTSGRDGEVFLDAAMAIRAILELFENVLAFDQLAENVLVAVEEVSFVEGDHEFGTDGVGAGLLGGQEASSVVSGLVILMGKTRAESTHILLADATSADSEALGAAVERGSLQGVASVGGAKSHEALRNSWGSVVVELEDHITDRGAATADSQVDSWVGTCELGGEIALANSENLLGEHFVL